PRDHIAVPIHCVIVSSYAVRPEVVHRLGGSRRQNDQARQTENLIGFWVFGLGFHKKIFQLNAISAADRTTWRVTMLDLDVKQLQPFAPEFKPVVPGRWLLAARRKYIW